MPLLFHFRQSYKMQGSFAKLSNFGDEIFTSKPAVTKNILGSQALMTPSFFIMSTATFSFDSVDSLKRMAFGFSALRCLAKRVKSAIKLVRYELLILNMFDNSEKLLNFASTTVTL